MHQPVKLVSLDSFYESIRKDTNSQNAYLHIDINNADVDLEYYFQANDIKVDIAGEASRDGAWATGVYLIRFPSESRRDGPYTLRVLTNLVKRWDQRISVYLWSRPLDSWIEL